VLLVSPGGGDELQGIKRGIMELADLVVVTKADGDLAAAARHACSDHRHALQLLRRPHRSIEPQALLVSSTEGTGIAEVWEQVHADHRALDESGDLDRLRARQRRAWLWTEVTDALMDRVRTDPRVADLVPAIEAEVDAGTLAPVAAARAILRRLD
jgi:LAO/AO transport system kinase